MLSHDLYSLRRDINNECARFINALRRRNEEWLEQNLNRRLVQITNVIKQKIMSCHERVVTTVENLIMNVQRRLMNIKHVYRKSYEVNEIVCDKNLHRIFNQWIKTYIPLLSYDPNYMISCESHACNLNAAVHDAVMTSNKVIVVLCEKHWQDIYTLVNVQIEYEIKTFVNHDKIKQYVYCFCVKKL